MRIIIKYYQLNELSQEMARPWRQRSQARSIEHENKWNFVPRDKGRSKHNVTPIP